MKKCIGKVYYCTSVEEGFYEPNEYFMALPSIIKADILKDIIREMEGLKDSSLSEMPKIIKDILGHGSY